MNIVHLVYYFSAYQGSQLYHYELIHQCDAMLSNTEEQKLLKFSSGTAVEWGNNHLEYFFAYKGSYYIHYA
jgi:hypothetical protein